MFTIRIKIGRNESCPCGSDKKFKKCCLLKENENDMDFERRIKPLSKKALKQFGIDPEIDEYFG